MKKKYFAKETYNFIDPTHCSHHISDELPYIQMTGTDKFGNSQIDPHNNLNTGDGNREKLEHTNLGTDKLIYVLIYIQVMGI